MRIPRWIKIPVPVATVVLLAGLALPAAAAPGGSPAAAGPVFPVFVHLPADQARHPGATYEWWYTVGHVSAHGHRFGYEVTLTESAGVPAFPRQQEVMASFPGVTPSLFEGAATVTGVAGGQPVNGQAYVEQLGHWN